jgi:hypothetical protein
MACVLTLQKCEAIRDDAPAACARYTQMDATFIEQNQIVERYLAGKLPVKGAQDFERHCREHPETVAQLGLAERINAGLRLLDASGQPEPWAEKPLAFYQKPVVIAVVTAVAFALLVTSTLLLFSNNTKQARIKVLEDELRAQPLLPARATRSILLKPGREGPLARSMVTIGGGDVELADLKIDQLISKFTLFRVTIDRVDQGKVAVISNLQKDSNGHLRLALNSSALGPGEYQLTIEGLDWRGAAQADAWASFTIAH